MAALFLMNNVHYIVKAVESSEALSCVGPNWIERHKDLIESYGEEYQVGVFSLGGPHHTGVLRGVSMPGQYALLNNAEWHHVGQSWYAGGFMHSSKTLSGTGTM